ncbi:hypothetical protein TNCV_3765041 [Trichonephila clavipes]|nr:hypothetical protein TNCV_3765041 [Trichonephila clavipes]
MIAVGTDFHKQILFSDKAHFWLNGYVTKQNCRIWSEANPQVYVKTPLHREKLTVLCALWAVYVNRLLWRVSVKHSALTLKDKVEVLKRLDKGEGVTKLATEFNIGDINEWMEEDGETAEFLTDDDIAAAVTQEPMEEEGSDDETQ